MGTKTPKRVIKLKIKGIIKINNKLNKNIQKKFPLVFKTLLIIKIPNKTIKEGIIKINKKETKFKEPK